MESSEVRVIVRPLKVIASICALVAAALIIISLATNYWLEADGFREGLWTCLGKECGSPTRKTCQVAIVAALILTVVTFVLILSYLLSRRESAKSILYISCLVAIFTAMVCLLITLIIFPVVFIKEDMYKYQEETKQTQWKFSWSYGVSWGSWLFLLGAAILLLIDRMQNTIVRNEKGFYDAHL